MLAFVSFLPFLNQSWIIGDHSGSLMILVASKLKRGTVIPVLGSVSDPWCLSRIPDPDFCPSRIPDLGSRIQKQQQKRGVINICCTFFCSHKNHKIENYINWWTKKFGLVYKELKELSTQQIVIKLSKIWVGIRDPGPVVKKTPDPGSGSATLVLRIIFWLFSHPGSRIQKQ